MVDDVSMCSMRAHLKWSAELGHCSSLLLKFTPHLKLSVLVDKISMCSVRAHLKRSLKFTPQVTSVTFNFTARFTIKFTASHLQVYCQSHLQVYCQSHLQVYYQCCLQVYCHNHLQVYPPPLETVIDDRSSIGRYMSSVRAHSKLLKFTPQVHSSTLPASFTPQSSTDIWNTITSKKFHK